MITIDDLTMRNWACFMGEQKLSLRPTYYAVVARSAQDAGRSNWNGKTRLMSGIDWCLHGRLPDGVKRKADLITHGEKSMEVSLALSDGHVVKRTFSAQPEKLWLFPPGDPERALLNDEAQAAIERLIGLNREDFLLCYMRQGAMARMVSMEASTRMETVSSWIRLAPLEACEDDAHGVLAEFSKRIEGKRRERADAEAVVRSELERHGCGAVEELAVRVGKELSEVERLDGEVARLRELRGRQEERTRLADDAARYDAIVAQGRELASRVAEPKTAALNAAVTQLDHELGVMRTQSHTIAERVRSRRLVATGKFDGACPLAGARCPAPKFVADAVSANYAMRAQDARDEASAGEAYQAKSVEHAEAAGFLRARQRDEQRLVDLREEARRLRGSKERHATFGETGVYDVAALSNASAELEGFRRRHAQLTGSIQAVEAKRAQMVEVDAELARLEAAARVAAAAAAIFGKGGAQRRMAEAALAEIEDRANQDVLAESGIELSVKVVWSRETAGLAAQCSGCGAAFPPSRRVKECGRCGAERGAQLTNKLELEPSDRSGAANDLAGFAFQVGASAWLRQDRLAGWGVAMLDEPFGQLDSVNGKALSSNLTGLLGRAGFGQGLVIAHDASVLNGLPDRIEIVRDGKHSTVRVVG